MEYIFKHQQESGIPPTLREICKHLGWAAVGSAQDVVRALRKKGILESSAPGKARQLVLSKLALNELSASENEAKENEFNTPNILVTNIKSERVNHPLLWVPVLGYVQAGFPSDAIEVRTPKQIPFYYPNQGKKNAQYFALIVEGESMLYAGFLPGDQLLVEKMHKAADGEIIVAKTSPGEATVKRFAVQGSDLYSQALRTFEAKYPHSPTPPAFLCPANPLFEPIPFGLSEDSVVLGIVRSLVRASIN